MSELGVEAIFLILGGIVFIGYFGEIISKRYSVPSALLLLVIGFLLRFTNNTDPAPLVGIQPLFGTLALIIILFDGSMSMNLYNVIFKSGKSALSGFIITILAMLFSGLLFSAFGFDFILGAIVGALAGGIGSTTTISIISGLNVPNSVKNFLTLESSITDVFSIIFTIILTVALVSGEFSIQKIGEGILGKFSIGALLGAVAGIIYLTLVYRIKTEYTYMVTFGVMLLLYAISVTFGGSGAISVLVFGVLLGNEKEVKRIFRIKNGDTKLTIRKFQTEVSFFVRTFFFVYLGFVVSVGSLQNFLIAVFIMAGLYIIRYFTINFILRDYTAEIEKYKNLISAMNPRGLATAVLATYPLEQLSAYLATNPSTLYYSKIMAESASLPEIAFYIILISIIVTTVSVPFAMNKINSNKKGKN